MELLPQKTSEAVREAGQGTGRNQVRMEKFQVNSKLSLFPRGSPQFVLPRDKGTGII